VGLAHRLDRSGIMTGRPVVAARLSGRTARLWAPPGSPATVDTIAELAARAGVTEARRARTAVFIPARALPDVEAMAELTRIVVVRTGARS
jgi:hypothetical protein